MGIAAPRTTVDQACSNTQERAQRILTQIASEIGPDQFGRYFQEGTQLTAEGSVVDVTASSRFIADLVQRRFGEVVRRAAQAECADAGEPVTVRFGVRAAEAATVAAPTPRAPSPALVAARIPRSRQAGVSYRHTLNDFLVGECNKLAYSAAMQLSDASGPRALSPLFIHGSCGMGKTHLLQGTAARFAQLHPGARVLYTTSEAFTNEYITALRGGTIDAFRRMHRKIDLLCLDDVHFLETKEKTQTELLHTFDALDLAGARIALASDGHPRQIEGLSTHLASRFVSGMVVRLEAPDEAMSSLLVRRMTARKGLEIDDVSVSLIVSRWRRFSRTGGASVRELEGLVNRVEAVHRLLPSAAEHVPEGRLTAQDVVRALGVDDRPTPTIATGGAGGLALRPVRMEQILAEVCRALQVDAADLMGTGRHKRVVLARALAVHLGRSLTTMSFPEIAKALGRPNHSTVITACQRIRRQMESNEAVAVGADCDGLTIRQLDEELQRSVRSARR